MKKALAIAAAVLAVAIAFGVHFYTTARRARLAEEARLAERAARLDRLGLPTDTMEEFFALPPTIPTDQRGADLGALLYHDKRLTVPKGRSCHSCHPLNIGGTDGKMHGGVFTRPVVNAGFADVFLGDGSVTGLTALVERMITDPNFGGGTNLALSAAWIGSDIKFSYRFKKRYPDGVTVSNALAALTAYVKTCVAHNGAFDRFCSGNKDALTQEERQGFDIFRGRRCTDCHDGPVLGAWKVVDGKKIPALRGLSQRKTYSAGGLRNDLGAVLPFMPGGDIESAAERIALVSFLKTL